MSRKDWNRVTTRSLMGFICGLAVLGVLLLASEDGFVFLVDHANLLFHEAGHPIVGLFSSRLEPYGGTLGQPAGWKSVLLWPGNGDLRLDGIGDVTLFMRQVMELMLVRRRGYFLAAINNPGMERH